MSTSDLNRAMIGQSLVEFSLSALVLVTFLVACSFVLKAQWDRAKCAYIVFEKTHQRVIRERSDRSRPYGVRGRGLCGGVEERVDLPWIESARW